jgi:hypothetical protein
LVIQPFKTHSQGGNAMTRGLLAGDTQTIICKHLPSLPPVVCDWQQSCQQPRCPHYCQGECCNPGRQGADASCPFDGKELLLEDAPAIDDSLSLRDQSLPKKG